MIPQFENHNLNFQMKLVSERFNSFMLMGRTRDNITRRPLITRIFSPQNVQAPAWVRTHDLLSVRRTHYQLGHGDKKPHSKWRNNKGEIWQNLKKKRYIGDFASSTRAENNLFFCFHSPPKFLKVYFLKIQTSLIKSKSFFQNRKLTSSSLVFCFEQNFHTFRLYLCSN